MKLLLSSVIVALFLFSCSGSSSNEEELRVDLVEGIIQTKGPFQLAQVKYKEQYELAQLTLKDAQLNEDDQTLILRFNEEPPEAYEIRYTVNNGRLKQSRSSELKVELLEGNNVVLAFLALSNGLRIPNPRAVYLENYSIGLNESSEVTKTGVHLFHNLSNTADSAAFYLDFYAENVPEGSNYFARLIADGNTFNVPLNKAYKLNGMTKEYHNLRIQLVDGAGAVVNGPFNDTGVISVEVE